jgi:hypothetical protein
VFATAIHFHPNLIFAGKDLLTRGLQSNGRLTLSTNIILV